MECEICLVPYNYNKLIPMVLECGHTLCKSCLGLIFNTLNVICPFCREKITKNFEYIKPNYALITLIGNEKQLASLNSSNASKDYQRCDIMHMFQEKQYLVCENKHALMWNDFKTRSVNTILKICYNCDQSIQSRYFSCFECEFYICENCENSVLRNHYLISCPYNHQLESLDCKLNDEIIRCDSCNIDIDGIAKSCQLCNFDLCYLCVQKLKNSINRGVFINRNELFWTYNIMNYSSLNGSSYFNCFCCFQNY